MFLIVIVIFCIIITDKRDNLNHVVKETKEFLQCYASYCDHLANFFLIIPKSDCQSRLLAQFES